MACSDNDETEFIDNEYESEIFITNSKDTILTNAITITYLEDNEINITNPFENKGVLISKEKGHVVINSTTLDTEINYVLSGKTMDGSVKIYSDYKFSLVLNGASIINPNHSAINIQSGKKVTVLLVGGTSNRLIDGSSYTDTSDEDAKGAFFSEGQLNFEGSGSLLVKGKSKHAICSDDYIRIKGGNITITGSVKNGIHANDYFRMDGGILNIKSMGDGIDCEKGYITLNGGKIDITTTGDASKGIKSLGDITIAGGEILITTTGNAYYDAEDADTTSSSGIKCDGNMTTSGNCIITITSSGSGGKGINVGGTLVFDNGTIKVTTTGDQYVYDKNNDTAAKAIKSDGNLTVNNGHITIKTSKTEAEGLESKATLTINGGTLEIDAYDDCINAKTHIGINGGNIYCYSATNDGIDSNGTLTITGGVVITSGTNVPEEGFDCDNNTFKITGGVLVGTGGATSAPTSSVSTQRTLIYNGSGTENQLFHIASADGASVFTYKIPRTYSQGMTLLVSSPDLAASNQYTIYTGGSVSGGTDFHGLYTGSTYSKGTSAGTFTTTSMVTTVGTSNGGGLGGGGGRP